MTGAPAPGERLFAVLVRLYPRAFRERYEPELWELFRYRRDARIAERGRLGPGFWLFVLRDWAATGWAERRGTLRRGGWGGNGTGGDGMMGWIDDIGYATRRLLRAPGFALTALFILVLGIGVNTTAFGFVNALLFQAPPFEDPERVVLVLQDSDGGQPNSTSYPAYLDITRYEVFSAASAYYTDQVFLEQDRDLIPVLAEYATASYVEVTGLSPARGRWFGVDQDDPAGPPAAVISHKMWSERLAGDPSVVGSTIRLAGRAIPVIGVGPEEFNGGFGPAPVDLWLSISAMGPTGGRVASLQRRQDHPFRVRARLAPGVTVEDAQAAMDGLAAELASTYPELNRDRRITVVTGTAAPDDAARIVPAAALSMAVVALVLVIGTLNLANLLLVRTTVRARELAVRLALGAGRARLVRVVLSEAIVLSVLGGIGGLLVAAGIARAVGKSQFDLGLPLSLDVRLDLSVYLFAFAAAVGTGLVFGLLPALRATASGVAGSLRDDGTAVIGARRRFGLTGLLVAGQVAASLLLLSVAGVFLESLGRARGADPGFDWTRTGYATVSIQALDLDREAAALLHERMLERIEGLPEVTGVSVALRRPGGMFGTTTLLMGSQLGGVDRPTEVAWNSVSPSFFDVMGVPVLAGRTFTETDLDGPTRAVVSEAMARTWWGRTDIVGESYRAENDPENPVEIIGVVGDVPVRTLGEAEQPSLYWVNGGTGAYVEYLFASAGEPERAISAIRAAISEVDDRVLVLDAAPMRQFLGATLQRQRLAGNLLGGLGALALLLAVLGVYGVVSFAVSRRRHEVGIRIALGAGRESVVALFARDVAAVVLVGGVLGLALAVPLAGAVGRFFTGSAGTPLSPVGAALLLVATALVATVVPAMRATRTDPTNALRQE